jgi:hypothetical protein
MVATLVSASAGLVVAEGVAAPIKPHRAFYEMELGVADQKSNVQVINGRSAFTLSRDCDGWLSSEDYVIEFGGAEGSVDRVLSSFESWESDAGDKYSFTITEQSSFDAAKDFNGYAITANDGGGEAFFSVGADGPTKLPADTYFPLRHLTAILNHAESGKKILAASVFTGAEPDDALLATNTVIGSWNDGRASDIFGGFVTDGYWSVRVAYFKPKAKAAEPEYEINYALQPNGVIRGYEIDYGEFTIVANMLKIEPVDEPSCR